MGPALELRRSSDAVRTKLRISGSGMIANPIAFGRYPGSNVKTLANAKTAKHTGNNFPNLLDGVEKGFFDPASGIVKTSSAAAGSLA